LNAADNDYLVTNQWNGWQVPNHLGVLLTNYEDELRLVHQAAEQKLPCDWGIDLSRGSQALVPHLADCKQSVITAGLDLQWKLHQGDEAGARDDLLGSLTLARNTSRGGALIGALVEMAIENIVCWDVARHFGQFSPPTLEQLVRGFDNAPARGTVAAAMATEMVFSESLINHIQTSQQAHPHDEAAVMAETYRDVGRPYETNYWRQLTNAAGGASDGLIKMLREAEAWHERLAGITALPHGQYENEFTQFSMAANKSGNFLVTNGLDGFNRSRQKEFSTQVLLAMTRAAMEYQLHGEAGLNRVSDPCGKGPFAFKRFEFKGEDRGFQLTSTYVSASTQKPVTLIFVEKDGPPFFVGGTHPGAAIKP
jgi:hypothetical protein